MAKPKTAAAKEGMAAHAPSGEPTINGDIPAIREESLMPVNLDKPQPGLKDLLVTMDNPYGGIAQAAFSREEREVLLAPLDPKDVEIRPDGMVYLPEIKYRRILNKAFGPGGWGLMKRSDWTMVDGTLMREYALIVHGRFVSEAIGEQDYIENNPNMTRATASEGVRSNAIMRCCKDLGIASELWDPNYLEPWRKENAIQVWRKSSQRPIWRRKDREPYYDERGPVGQNPTQTLTRQVEQQPPDDDFSWDKAKQSEPPAGTIEAKGSLGLFKPDEPKTEQKPTKATKPELSTAVKLFQVEVNNYLANHNLGRMTREEAERYIIKHCSMIEAQFDKEGKQIVKAHPGVDSYEAMSDKLAAYALKQLKASEET